MDYAAAALQAAEHIRSRYREETPSWLCYHNQHHVERVVEHARQMAQHYQLPEREAGLLEIAGWFHDIGWLHKNGEDHESRGARIAGEWMTGQGFAQEDIDLVSGCIMATRMPQQPQTLPEQILADADLYELGTENFKAQRKLLRRETELLSQRTLGDDAWRQEGIALMTAHRYHTDYARQLLDAGKMLNLTSLQKKGTPKNGQATGAAPGRIRIGRGIETLFRVTSANNMELTSIADSKANILISVNSIIISVVLTVLVTRLDEIPQLMMPTVVLLVVNVTTIVFAILAVRPKLLRGGKPQPGEESTSRGLLFFGNFHKMPVELYEEQMLSLLNDNERLYGSLAQNIYFQGKVLARKFAMLRIAYNVFMYGLIISVLAFILTFLIRGTDSLAWLTGHTSLPGS